MRLLIALLFAAAVPVGAQEPIGRTAATEVQVSGAVNIAHGETILQNGSAITAGKQSVTITLQRGGSLKLCSASSVHLSKDSTIADPSSSALMMALDRGALEVNYPVGTYSDVLLTADLRILISAPGQADLRIRVNTQGDTCVDNHGANAPYVTVSSQLEGGAYRVMPDQRVSFQHGSLQEVVDHEPEPCGCPVVPPLSVADNIFPIAESEGLAPPPAPRPLPIVPVGKTHAQITAQLTYNGENPAPAEPTPTSPALGPAAIVAAGETHAPVTVPLPNNADSAAPVQLPAPAPVPAPPPVPAELPPAPPPARHGFFHSIGHAFSRIFKEEPQARRR